MNGMIEIGGVLALALLYRIGATPWRSMSYYCGLIATIVFATQLPFGG